MKEKPRNWAVSIQSDLRVAYAYDAWGNRQTFGVEIVIQEGLTKEEALAMLATIGKVKTRLQSDEGFYAYAEEGRNERRTEGLVCDEVCGRQ